MKMPPPDEYAVSQPAGYTSLAELWAKLIDYFVSNVAATVVMVWSVLLFAGGMIFLFHFYSIGFMPELNPQASITLLAAAILTAGFLLIGLIFTLFAPALLWNSLLLGNERLKVLWYKDEQFVPWRAMLWVGLPLEANLGGLILLYFLTTWWGINISWFSVLPFVVGSIPALVVIWKKLPDRWCVATTLWIKLGSSGVGVVLSLLALYSFVRLMVADLGATYALILFIVLLVLITLSNANIMTRPRMPLWQYFIVSLTVPCAIFTIFNGWTLIPKQVVRIYQFGNLPNASLILDETGCAIVQHHKLKMMPHTLDPTNTTLNPNLTNTNPNPKPTCSLSPVTIHSRLGSPYYLEASPHDGPTVRFTIPGQNVLSWAINEPNKASTTGAPTSPKPLAPAAETP